MNEERELIATLQRLQDEGTPCALVTVVRCERPTSARPGQKAVVTATGIVHGWIGGGCAQPAVMRTVAEALSDGRAQLIRVAPRENAGDVEGLRDFHSGCASGGTLDLFVDPLVPAPLVRVWGNSPVGRHVCAAAAAAGLRVQVAAPGTEATDYPASECHVADLATPADWPPPRWAVVATQGRGDRPALEAALASAAERVALIASRRKADHLKGRMAEREVPADRLEAIVAPAGIDIHARTPAEIGLSVAAQLVSWRREGADTAAVVSRVTDESEAPADAPTATAGTSSGHCCGG